MVGSRIKLIRTQKKLTQKAFAEALSTSAGYISEIESGKKMPGGELLTSLKRIFNIDLNWLLNGEEDLPHQKISPSDTLTQNLSPEHLLLINSYDAAEDSIKDAALTILKNSAEKSKSTDRKDSSCPKLKSG